MVLTSLTNVMSISPADLLPLRNIVSRGDGRYGDDRVRKYFGAKRLEYNRY